jgi:Zn-finger protein
MQVKLLPSNINSYNQVGQDSDVEWSPLRKDGENLEQCHPFFFCRDYFNEVVANRADGKIHKQYGFSIDWRKEDHPDTTEFLMVTQKFDQIIKGIEEFLYPIEDRHGYKRTEFFKLDSTYKGKEIWRVSGDAIWMSSPILISAYTLALRNFYYYDTVRGNRPSFFGDWRRYYRVLLDKEIKDTQVKEWVAWAPPHLAGSILDNAKEFAQTPEQLTSVMKEVEDDNFLHNYCGIVNGTKYLYGYWQTEHRKVGGMGNHYTIKPYTKAFPMEREEVEVLLDKLAEAPVRSEAQSKAFRKWMDNGYL